MFAQEISSYNHPNPSVYNTRLIWVTIKEWTIPFNKKSFWGCSQLLPTSNLTNFIEKTGWKFSKMEPLSQEYQAHQNLSKILKWTRYFFSFFLLPFIHLPSSPSSSSIPSAQNWFPNGFYNDNTYSLRIGPNCKSLLYLCFSWSKILFPK